MRQIIQNAKYKGKPCPKNLFEISDCEKEGLADDSVPDCDSKIDIPATWSKWSSWGGCRGDCGIQGKVIYSYIQLQTELEIFNFQ